MNIFLWILQGFMALFFAMGAVNQLFNYGQISQQFAIYQALPQGFWIVYGVITLLAVLGLVLTRIKRWVTPVAATVLTLQGWLFAGLYAHYAGFVPTVAAWAGWTLLPTLITAFIAYARFTEKR